MEKLNLNIINNKMIELANKIEYKYTDIKYLTMAMRAEKLENKNTNGKNHKEHTNDALATVGDSVLKLALADILFEDGKNKGDITKEKEKLENNIVLDMLTREMDLIQYAYHDRAFYYDSKSEDRVSSTGNHTVYLEAIIGAIYKDLGFEKTKEWIKKWLKPLLEKVANENISE